MLHINSLYKKLLVVQLYSECVMSAGAALWCFLLWIWPGQTDQIPFYAPLAVLGESACHYSLFHHLTGKACGAKIAIGYTGAIISFLLFWSSLFDIRKGRRVGGILLCAFFLLLTANFAVTSPLPPAFAAYAIITALLIPTALGLPRLPKL